MPQVLKHSVRDRRDNRLSDARRGSPADRGYDARWKRESKAYRIANPFCARCLEHGITRLIVNDRTGVVDHKRPWRHGGEFWDRRNWWGLCNDHHDGWKKQLEEYALRHDRMDQIQMWCDDPTKRPVIRGAS
jgi:5-methylcytosine-specific restriction endonuclease McrA